jgi:hypothetical protein
MFYLLHNTCKIPVNYKYISVNFIVIVFNIGVMWNAMYSEIQNSFAFFTYLLTHSLTHSLTPYSTALLEKLTGLQPFKKFSTFYGT